MGLAAGDALGAPYEGGPIERLVWKMLGKTKSGRCRYTDDTQMSIDLANSFLEQGLIDQDHLAQTFATSYRWSRGYGPSAATLLKKIAKGEHWSDVNRLRFKEGSLGNGAAMRAPVVAMIYPNNADLLAVAVTKCSEITHAHPLAIEGAQLIAFVTCAALNDLPLDIVLESLPKECSSTIFSSKIECCVRFVSANQVVAVSELKRNLGNGIVATESCATAIYFGLKYKDESFESMLRDIAKLGGDVDTIGAMAGAIWGAYNGGHTFSPMAPRIESSEEILGLSQRLFEFSNSTIGEQA